MLNLWLCQVVVWNWAVMPQVVISQTTTWIHIRIFVCTLIVGLSLALELPHCVMHDHHPQWSILSRLCLQIIASYSGNICSVTLSSSLAIWKQMFSFLIDMQDAIQSITELPSTGQYRFLLTNKNACSSPFSLKGHSHRFSRNFLFFTMHNWYISDHKTKCLCHTTS
jgi:hypothetical protein